MSQRIVFPTGGNPGTAVITGASSGLGASFARQLAERGFGLVLTARREDRLRVLAEKLSSEFRVRCEVLAADLSEDAGILRVCERIGAIGDLDILVNNAGFGTAGNYADVPIGQSMRMVNVHVAASMRLAHAALGAMRARKRGAIINVASMAAFAITPGDVVYDATKAFLVAFSEALALETGGEGIRIQALCPGFTHTEFHDAGKMAGLDAASIPRTLWMEADRVVSLSLQALGRKGRTVFIPGWKNRASTWLVRHSGAVRRMLQRAKRKRDAQ